MTISVFRDELAQVRTKKKEFLAQIERIVPWKEWLLLIQPCYYKGERGNKPYPLEIMLRLYLLQNLYDLRQHRAHTRKRVSPIPLAHIQESRHWTNQRRPCITWLILKAQ